MSWFSLETAFLIFEVKKMKAIFFTVFLSCVIFEEGKCYSIDIIVVSLIFFFCKPLIFLSLRSSLSGSIELVV